MGPGQAPPLPGRSPRAGAAAGAAGHRGPRRWEERLVHRGGVAHFEDGGRTRAGTALPGFTFLPEGGPEEYSGVEVCRGPGGAAEGLTSPPSRVQGDCRQPVCVLCSGASHLSDRPR